MRQSEECLHLPGYVCEGRHDTSLKVVHRFRVVASLKFVLTSRNQESLFGPEATFLRGGAHSCTELLTGERKIALDPVFSHVINPPFFVWRICGAIAEKPPPHIALTAQKLWLKSQTMRAHPFMFQYPPLHAANPSSSHFCLPQLSLNRANGRFF